MFRRYWDAKNNDFTVMFLAIACLAVIAACFGKLLIAAVLLAYAEVNLLPMQLEYFKK